MNKIKKLKIGWIFLILLVLPLTLIILFPPRTVIKILSPLICPKAVYFVETKSKIIALTIDDSPDKKTTDRILDTLAKHQIKATFFPITDYIKGNEKAIKRMVKEGHEIGNHLTRDEKSIKLGNSFSKELEKAHNILSEYNTIKWMRPGGGWCNKEMVEASKKYNYKVALGSVFPYDTNINSPKFSSLFILLNTSPGSIIVLHDGRNRGENTIETLETIIPKLKKQNYRFVSLSELTSDRVMSNE